VSLCPSPPFSKLAYSVACGPFCYTAIRIVGSMQEMNILRPARHWSHSLDFGRLFVALRSLVAFALLMAVTCATLAQIPAAEPRPVSTVFRHRAQLRWQSYRGRVVFFDEKARPPLLRPKPRSTAPSPSSLSALGPILSAPRKPACVSPLPHRSCF